MTQKRLRFYIVTRHVLLAAAATLIIGLVYGAVQQNYRQGANDPQVQLSEDSAEILNQGQDPQDLVPGGSATDMAKSLAAFIIIYDDSGKVAAASAQLDGSTPAVPSGVLEFAKAHNQERFTWEPKSGVRVAAVITRYGGDKPGYVMVGRSLREVEKREEALSLMVAVAWGGSMLVILLLLVMALWRERGGRHHPAADADTAEA